MIQSERSAGGRFAWSKRPWLLRSAGLLIGLVLSATALVHLLRPDSSLERWPSRPREELEALARRDPSHAGAQMGLGIQHARAGDMERATAALERCRALAPHRMEPHAALGEIARRRNDHPRAAQMFAAAVRLDPAFTQGYLHAANACTQMQEYRRARPLAESYSRRKPDDWRGPFLLGMISSGEGKMEEAKRHYTEAARRDPQHGPTYLNAGATFLYGPSSPDRLAAAAAWLERGIGVAPAYPELHYYLGLVRYRQRRWEEASRALQQSVDLKPAFTEAYYPLAQSLKKLGHREDARACLEIYTRLRAAERRSKPVHRE